MSRRPCRQTTAELNKGESRNALALVTGAIALWNTVYLGRALEALRARGEAVPDALLAHVAPSGWQHINLTGDYLWGAEGNLGPRTGSGRCGISGTPAPSARAA